MVRSGRVLAFAALVLMVVGVITLAARGSFATGAGMVAVGAALLAVAAGQARGTGRHGRASGDTDARDRPGRSQR